MKARTVAGLLCERAHGATAGAVAIRFLEKGEWREWTWSEYWAAGQRAAANLLASGVQAGDHVLLVTPDVRATVTALFGLWTIGAAPIAVGLPFQLQERAAFIAGLGATAAKLGVRFVLTTPALQGFVDGLGVLSTDKLDWPASTAALPDPDDAVARLAFIQLTSGSTGHPRGVMIGHDRLMLHLRSMSEALPSHADSVAVSWLPLHHDMGLLGGLLFPFFNGFCANMIATGDFQGRPGVWLETMSRFRGTIAAAPPSAYSICVQLAPRLLSRNLDLSAWECAMIGAEPIPAALLRKFAEAFAPAGFRSGAFFPVYGLAEATVAVTFPKLLAETRFDRVSRVPLERDGQAAPADEGAEEDALEFVGVGAAIPGTELRITDADGGSLPDRQVGEVRVRSTTLSSGYYGEDRETAATFAEGGWLRTGDLGYLVDGTLFVTGRHKELIIKGGHNLIPSVLEEIAGSVAGVRAVAAVGIVSLERATENVWMVVETRVEGPEVADAVRVALKVKGIAVDRVVLVPPKSLPRTTSGKLKRVAIAQMVAERFC